MSERRTITDSSRHAAGPEPAERDLNSLRSKALRRAMHETLPKTLTPYEWEQWYAEHGVPESHRDGRPAGRKRWWQIWKRT